MSCPNSFLQAACAWRAGQSGAIKMEHRPILAPGPTGEFPLLGHGKGSGCKSTHKSLLPLCLAILTHPFLRVRNWPGIFRGQGALESERSCECTRVVQHNTTGSAPRSAWGPFSINSLWIPLISSSASLWGRANLADCTFLSRAGDQWVDFCNVSFLTKTQISAGWFLTLFSSLHHFLKTI